VCSSDLRNHINRIHYNTIGTPAIVTGYISIFICYTPFGLYQGVLNMNSLPSEFKQRAHFFRFEVLVSIYTRFEDPHHRELLYDFWLRSEEHTSELQS